MGMKVPSLASKLLRDWRIKHGVTQVKAAELFEVRQPTLSEYESGQKIPRTELALRIARVTENEVPIEAWGTPLPAEEAAPPATGTHGGA